MRGPLYLFSPYIIDVPGRERPPHRNAPEAPKKPRRKLGALRISDFCFVIAGLAALTGMTMGMAMGIAQDFTLAPAHAHLNLLGWVTMALYGLYHRANGRTRGWLGWLQVLSGAVGGLSMSGGLAHYLHTGDDSFAALIIAGSLLAVLGMLLFVAIILIDMLGRSEPSSEASTMKA